MSEQVATWTGELNDALACIGRPFGYRTRNAIRAYVKQYPDQSEEGIRLAVADEVEQRILPKLRGVDVTEEGGQRAIEGVLQVLKALGDDQLLAAVESGANPHGSHLFTWFGVERTDDD